MQFWTGIFWKKKINALKKIRVPVEETEIFNELISKIAEAELGSQKHSVVLPRKRQTFIRSKARLHVAG